MSSFSANVFWVMVKVAYIFSVSKLLHGFLLEFVSKRAVCSGGISS